MDIDICGRGHSSVLCSIVYYIGNNRGGLSKGSDLVEFVEGEGLPLHSEKCHEQMLGLWEVGTLGCG